jgi:hypothetical protein
MTLGVGSFVCGAAALVLVFPSLGGLLLGAGTWVMARRDLRLMRAGLMDQKGKQRTVRSRDYGRAGVFLSLVSWLFWGLLYLAVRRGG